MKRWTLLVVVALLVLSLACSFGQKSSTPEPAGGGGSAPATEAPQGGSGGGEATVAPSAGGDTEDGDEAALPTYTGDELEGLNSYRSTITFHAETDNGTVVEDGSITIEETRDPQAYHMVMSGMGNDPQDQVEMIAIGQDQWIKFGDEWMYAQAGEDETSEFGDVLFSPEEIFSDMAGNDYDYLGKETVNGVKTKHYRFQITADAAAAFAEMGSVEADTVDVWVANEHGLPEIPIKIVIVVKGEVGDNGEHGTATITMELSDVNANFTIEPPADAGANAFAGLPEYPNATDVSIFGSMFSFHTTDDVETVQAFYEKALTDAGWTKGEISEMEGMVMEDWTKDDQTLSLMITADEENGGSSVMLMTGE